MGHAQAAMPNISAREREGWRGASRPVNISHIPTGLLGGPKPPTILITTAVLAMGRKSMTPSPDASI
jgi:hypothetical protein